MTIQLYRVPDPNDAIYVSQDGKIQLAFREDYPLIKDMPPFMEVSFWWDELPLACQAFLFACYERWIGRSKA